MPASGLTTQQVEDAFAASGVYLPAGAAAQFCFYLELLTQWNQRLNLTAVRDPEQMLQRHLVECGFAAQHLPRDIQSLLDYGSGGGLPGIVLAVCRPEIRVTLAEAQAKKASFLGQAVRLLGLNAEVHDGRVEAMPVGLTFDAVSMRAVEKMERALPVASARARRYLVLLTTLRSSPPPLWTPAFEWNDPLRVPNTDQIVLAIGERRS